MESNGVRLMGWVRRDQGSTPDLLLLALALVLVRLPVALGAPYAWPLRVMVLPPLLLSILRAVMRVARGQVAWVNGIRMLLLACYVSLVPVSIFRASLDGRVPLAAALDGGLALLTLAVVGAIAFLDAPSAERREGLRLGILAGLVIHLAVDLGMYLVGARHAEIVCLRELPASILGFPGLRVSAVLFPMAGGVNAFGTIGGATLAMSGAVLVRRARTRWPTVLAMVGLCSE
jgi:hypothetical protein